MMYIMGYILLSVNVLDSVLCTSLPILDYIDRDTSKLALTLCGK